MEEKQSRVIFDFFRFSSFFPQGTVLIFKSSLASFYALSVVSIKNAHRSG